ncbi:anaerobic ribonucleoside-triphosphate reductase activating protein [Spirochaetia bacterium]|nr:anaerobic ribonucleoside-triphosphate reductase activating protein [Spirochaetia bacterium]
MQGSQLNILVSLRKTSLVDYPGKIAAVIFIPGCNLRCPWCQNRELVLDTEKAPGAIFLEEALEQIEKRRNVLGGVVLSGGEPTLYRDLPDLIRRIKTQGKPGLPVKLDTNGTFPAVLEELLSRPDTRPDYIAMDLKIAPSRYAVLLSGGAAAAALAPALQKSAALIRSSGIAHEFRSLILPGGFFGPADREALAPLAADSPWNFRPFRPGNCLDPAWDDTFP